MEWLPAPAPPLKLPPGEIHLWRFSLDLESERLPPLADVLAADELARAGRFRFERDRRRFITRRGRLRHMLAAYLGEPAGSLIFSTGIHGRPQLENASGLDFNASHSGEIGLLAVACRAQIGVDVERHRPEVDHLAIAGRFFSPAEQAQLRELPVEQQVDGFFRCWTRKEAYIKALGLGLSLPLDRFDVSLAPDAPPRLLAARGGLPGPEQFQMLHLEVESGYAAALCLPVGGWQVRFWRMAPPDWP